MKQETKKSTYFMDFFQDSHQGNNLNFNEFSPLLPDISRGSSQEDKPLQHSQPQAEQKRKNRSSLSKLQKSSKIRTSRNVQKTYHNILKHWLEMQHYQSILPKYNQFFNQRVYFILVLDEIAKQIDGEMFAASYERLAREVIGKKQAQIFLLENRKENSEQSKHLRRVIEEIEFSIKACKQFIAGNVLDSLMTVYKRNQDKITKMKDFQKAVKTYREVTGHDPQNF